MLLRCRGKEERVEGLSADYRRRRHPLRTLAQAKRSRHALKPAPPAYRRYGALQDEVPDKDMEWDLENADGDLGISPPQGSASWSCREEEEYMEGVRQGVLGGAYVEEPQRSRLDSEEEMDVGAVGSHGGRRWEPCATSQPALMVSKAKTPPCWKT